VRSETKIVLRAIPVLLPPSYLKSREA